VNLDSAKRLLSFGNGAAAITKLKGYKIVGIIVDKEGAECLQVLWSVIVVWDT
jgi:hypothetical protein